MSPGFTLSRSVVAPLLALALAIIPVFAAGCDPDAAEKAAIRDTMETLGNAVDAGDARTYTSLVTQRTFAYYDRILEVANTARNTEVAKLPAIERSMVLSARHRIPLEERKKMDGRALLTRAIAERWWADNPDDDESPMDFGEIKVNGAYARANVKWEGKRTAFWHEFIRENDYGQADPTAPWKLDEPTCDAFWNDRIGRWARQLNMSEDDLLIYVEAEGTGRPVRRNIWDIP